MPQMAPLMWVFLYMFFLISFWFLMVIVYFYSSGVSSCDSTTMSDKKVLNYMFWRW